MSFVSIAVEALSPPASVALHPPAVHLLQSSPMLEVLLQCAPVTCPPVQLGTSAVVPRDTTTAGVVLAAPCHTTAGYLSIVASFPLLHKWLL